MDSKQKGTSAPSGSKQPTKTGGGLLSALKRKQSTTGTSDTSPKSTREPTSGQSSQSGRSKSLDKGSLGASESFNSQASKEAAKIVSEWVKSGAEKTTWASDIAKIISSKLK